MPKFIDRTGVRFGRLVVVERVFTADKTFGVTWKCLCDCGNEKTVPAARLVGGNTKSCGCLQPESNRENAKINVTHGKSETAEYATWLRIRSRCNCKTNPKYHRYGGRGIKICDRWDDFDNFHHDMGDRPSPKHSIDRINNDGDYEPGNCRWATNDVQAANKSTARVITHCGITDTLTGWSERLSMNISTLHNWLAKGKPLPRFKDTP